MHEHEVAFYKSKTNRSLNRTTTLNDNDFAWTLSMTFQKWKVINIWSEIKRFIFVLIPDLMPLKVKSLDVKKYNTSDENKGFFIHNPKRIKPGTDLFSPIFVSLGAIMIWLLVFYNKIAQTSEDNVLGAVETNYFSTGLVICIVILVLIGVFERLFYKGKLTKDYMLAGENKKKPWIPDFQKA